MSSRAFRVVLHGGQVKVDGAAGSPKVPLLGDGQRRDVRGWACQRLGNPLRVPTRPGDIPNRGDQAQSGRRRPAIQHPVQAVLWAQLLHDGVGPPRHAKDAPARFAGGRRGVLRENGLMAAVKRPDAEVHNAD